MSRPIAIYAGYTVRYPLGGRIAAELQNLIGLQRLGYDVVFVEESGSAWAPCYDPIRGEMTRDPAYGLGVLQGLLEPFGLAHRWCYVDSDRRYHGLSATALRDLCRSSTLLFSLAATTWLPEFADCRQRVLIDTDPGFTQFGMSGTPSRSCSGYASPYDFHHLFTYGSRIGQPDCPIPTHGLPWQPTRPPVVLDMWPVTVAADTAKFTTVMSWSNRQPIVYDGEEYGQKNIEFSKVIDLPQRVAQPLEIALAGSRAPRDEILQAGWQLAKPLEVTADFERYREYISQSRGEFSVAVNLVVKSASGWFSERTAKYLAAGKPCVVQETGFSASIPSGDGLFAFGNVAEAARAIEAINRDYDRQCRAARDIAEEYFAAEKVLGAVLRQCDLPGPLSPAA